MLKWVLFFKEIVFLSLYNMVSGNIFKYCCSSCPMHCDVFWVGMWYLMVCLSVKIEPPHWVKKTVLWVGNKFPDKKQNSTQKNKKLSHKTRARFEMCQVLLWGYKNVPCFSWNSIKMCHVCRSHILRSKVKIFVEILFGSVNS